MVQEPTLYSIMSVLIHTLAFDSVFLLSDCSLFDSDYFCFLFRLFRYLTNIHPVVGSPVRDYFGCPVAIRNAISLVNGMRSVYFSNEFYGNYFYVSTQTYLPVLKESWCNLV